MIFYGCVWCIRLSYLDFDCTNAIPTHVVAHLFFSFHCFAFTSKTKFHEYHMYTKKAVERLCMYALHALTFDCTYIIIHQRLSS